MKKDIQINTTFVKQISTPRGMQGGHGSGPEMDRGYAKLVIGEFHSMRIKMQTNCSYSLLMTKG